MGVSRSNSQMRRIRDAADSDMRRPITARRKGSLRIMWL
jgi:hypothetical protein